MKNYLNFLTETWSLDLNKSCSHSLHVTDLVVESDPP